MLFWGQFCLSKLPLLASLTPDFLGLLFEEREWEKDEREGGDENYRERWVAPCLSSSSSPCSMHANFLLFLLLLLHRHCCVSQIRPLLHVNFFSQQHYFLFPIFQSFRYLCNFLIFCWVFFFSFNLISILGNSNILLSRILGKVGIWLSLIFILYLFLGFNLISILENSVCFLSY